MESDIYKISKSKRYSSIFYGPITTVYGFGILSLILLKKYIIDRLKCRKIWKIIIAYLLSLIILTSIEYIGGNVLKIIFNIDMWNYEEKTYNIGKYICLELSIIWGLFGVIYIFYLKDFIDKIIALIPKWLSYVWIIIFTIDLIIVILTK
jgi:uncharacterized membrane protein